MKLIEKLKNEMALRKYESEDFFREINAKNITSLKYVILLFIPLNIIYSILFSYMLFDKPNEDVLWKQGIIGSHLAMLFGFILLGIYIRKNKSIFSNEIDEPLVLRVFYVFVLICSLIITGFDQLVTNSITPYLLTSLAIPVFFVFKIRFAISIAFSSFLIFILLLPNFQSDSGALFSNLINGFTVLAVSITLTVTNWRFSLSKFRQDRIIQEQKRELEIQNSKLQQFANELSQANATKDKFFSIIAHDLKSPISGFIGITKLLDENLPTFTAEEIQSISKNLHKSSKNILDLLTNLLEWSKMQQNLVEFNPVNTDLSFIVRNTIDLLKEQLNLKEIKIINKFPAEIVVLCDANMISTVFRNLISNAIKFSLTGSSIEVGIMNSNPYNHKHAFYVSDQGIGMPEHIRNSIFKYDVNTSRKGTSGEPSTGLGLILCKDFINFHKGEIWIESEVNVGTTFYFSLNN